MSLVEPVIRPPSEAYSFLLQVTLGCSQNNCTFCGAYLNKPFKPKSLIEIKKDIAFGSQLYPETKRVFLCDGDALVLNNEKLLPILKDLNNSFPKLSRIASYANAQNILNKTPDELKELYEHKLKLLFIGLESGDNKVLKRMNKSATAEQMVEAVQKAQAVGIKVHVIVLLGLGEASGSKEHALATARIVNQMQPRYLSALSLMLIPGTPLHTDYRNKKFKELTPQELIQETIWLIENLELEHTIFSCNHTSNYVPLDGRLPHDKETLLKTLHAAQTGQIGLKPEFFRGL